MKLKEIAHARSGDKGNHANIGVIARDASQYVFLCNELTEARVAEYFAPLGPKGVKRYLLPGIHAMNFMLYDVLAGGACKSLRIDSQGKTLALALLEWEI
ncbi:MAG: hypothetical protein WD065_10080 [Planctomycetaceae bacterium]